MSVAYLAFPAMFSFVGWTTCCPPFFADRISAVKQFVIIKHLAELFQTSSSISSLNSLP